MFKKVASLAEEIRMYLNEATKFDKMLPDLMEVIHRGNTTLRSADALIAKYGCPTLSGKTSKFWFTGRWKNQVTSILEDLNAVCRQFSTRLSLGLANHVHRKDEIEMLKHAAWLRPEVSPGQLHTPAKKGHHFPVSQFVAGGPRQRNASGATAVDVPIIVLAQAGQWNEVIQKLMKEPDLISQSDPIYTLLHYAVFCECSYAVAMLLSFGAEVNAPTLAYDEDYELAEGTTPLMLAVAVCSPTLCQLLICWGADVHIQNKGGLGPHDMPTIPGCKEVLDDVHLRERAQKLAHLAQSQQFEEFEHMMLHHELPLDIKVTAESDYFIISWIAHACNLRLYRLMIARGASANLQTKNGQLFPSQICADQRQDPKMELELLEQEAQEEEELQTKGQSAVEIEVIPAKEGVC